MKFLAITIVTVVITLIIAIAGGQNNAATDGGISIFIIAALIAFGVNWFAYIPANILKTEKFFDLTGALTYLSVIAISCLLVADLDARAIITALCVVIWALRLGSFLFMRIHNDGGDIRFDKIKNNPMRFLLVWTLQGTWVLITSAAALAIITTQNPQELGVFAYIGLSLWVFGFAIEVIADRQKSAFRKIAANKGRYINTGLWAWSRHPNYFGEITLWVGITVMALPLLSGWQWIILISPIFVTLLLTKISGIPGLEQTAQKRWGDEKQFQDYVKNTSVLIPLPPKT